jgi:hypothetical protein
MSSTAGKRKPLWQKPFLWVGALIVAALGTALTNAIQPLFDRGISAWTEGGEPVSVRIELQRRTEDVLLPAEVHLTDQDLQMLDGMRRVTEQVDWLESRGGVITGQRTLMITLRGERSGSVRITDIRDASECAPPDRGSLFRMVFGQERHLIPHVSESTWEIQAETLCGGTLGREKPSHSFQTRP